MTGWATHPGASAGTTLAGDAVGGSSCVTMLVIRPWVSTGSSMRNRCAPRTDITNTTRPGRLLVTDTRRSCPAPASLALTYAGGFWARNAGAKWARSAASGIGSLPSAWKNHCAWAPAGVPGNAGPEPADGRGLPPQPASTTRAAAARTADRRQPALLGRSRPVVFAGADPAVAGAFAPSPGAASLASPITPSPSDEAPAEHALVAAAASKVSAGTTSARRRPLHGPLRTDRARPPLI